MAKLTREEIIKIEYELASPYGMVKLKCDGYTVDIRVEREKPLKYILGVYINGVRNMSWVKGDCEEAKRFCRPIVRPFYSAQEKAKLIRSFGKRRAAEYFPKLNESHTSYMPFWPSAKTMLRHFSKTCVDLEVVNLGYPASTEQAA
ncbi:hypothetical protein [Ralstonia pseudosolanacearum]|uniref:hypothetical protein n=1 Tax=Ralstonia pseudosolanacearum TaxID=1310165 RepID=UPI0008D8EAC6|nr:hypothetical protein [Ralstonia pseudosolanacearum]MCL1618357.1 hypothetical protein [Ralstonia pseudosolanacearum CaRs-Mep]